MNRSKLNIQSGFTLIEVLIALMIVSIAIISISMAVRGAVHTFDHLQQKTIAHWVGMNKLTAIQLGVDVAKEEGTTEMLGQTWYFSSTTTKNSTPGIDNVIVTVRRSTNNSTPIAEILGFQLKQSKNQ